MDLQYTIVTNCQKETMAAIVLGKGDYVLALKGNPRLFYEESRVYFEEGVLKNGRRKKAIIKRQ